MALGNEWKAGVDTLIIRKKRWSGGYDEEWLHRIDMSDVVHLTKVDPSDTAHSPTTQITVEDALDRIRQHNERLSPSSGDRIPDHEVQVFLTLDLVPVLRDAAEILHAANPEAVQPERLPF